jgi:hypothetical protein
MKKLILGLLISMVMVTFCIIAHAIRVAGIAENHLQNINMVANAITTYIDERHMMPTNWLDLYSTGKIKKNEDAWEPAEKSVHIKWPIEESKIRLGDVSTGDYISTDQPVYSYDAQMAGIDGDIRSKLRLPNFIDKETLQQMFDHIHQVCKWDIDKPMLWGYFFVHSTQAHLNVLGKYLVAQGYDLVEVYQDDKNNGEKWNLHVQKVEVQTVDTLDRRDHELQELASKFGVDRYDGMEVGPAP